MSAEPIVPLSGSKGGRAARPTGTEAAVRVADVLFLFIQGPASLGVSAVARELGLSKAVVHRIFQSLTARRFLDYEPGTRTYRLGPAAAALGARAMRDLDLRTAARPVLESLRDQTGETTTLSELVGDSRVYLDQFESRQTIKMSVELGIPHALHAGSTGKVMLAYLPADARKRLLSHRLEKLTTSTITDPKWLASELREIAARGYAVSLGERQHDAGSVAAPIFSSGQHLIGAISVCGPIGRFDQRAVQSHAALVRVAAAEISRALGWSGQYPE